MQSLSAVPSPSWRGQAAAEDPVCLEVTADAARLLKELAGIGDYPPVLALLTNVYGSADRGRVPDSVATELAEQGVIADDRVHPVVTGWLRCLDRPDVELVARVVDTDLAHELAGMLRMSLVRSGDAHVLAMRCDDRVVIQPVFGRAPQLDFVVAALSAALGPCPALQFEPVTISAEQLAEVPVESVRRRRALLELGAAPHTAAVLARAFDEIERRAEVVVVQHRDGGSPRPEVCVSVFDTPAGRALAVPRVAMDGGVRTTFVPGDETALQGSIGTLVDLLPGRNWFDTNRSQ